jgi:hypothetical protein
MASYSLKLSPPFASKFNFRSCVLSGFSSYLCTCLQCYSDFPYVVYSNIIFNFICSCFSNHQCQESYLGSLDVMTHVSQPCKALAMATDLFLVSAIFSISIFLVDNSFSVLHTYRRCHVHSKYPRSYVPTFLIVYSFSISDPNYVYTSGYPFFGDYV